MAKGKGNSRKRKAPEPAADGGEAADEEEEKDEDDEGPPSSQEVPGGGSSTGPMKTRIVPLHLCAMAKQQKTTPDVMLARWLFKHPSKSIKDLGFSYLRDVELIELNSHFAPSVHFDKKQIGQSIGRMYGHIRRLVDKMESDAAADGAGSDQASSSAAANGKGSRSARAAEQAEAARVAEEAAATERAERHELLREQWQAFLGTVQIGHMVMLSIFLDLPKLHSNYNPKHQTNGSLRENMRTAPGDDLEAIAGTGLFEATKRAQWDEQVKKQIDEAKARQDERDERAKIFRERTEAVTADVEKVYDALRVAMGKFPGWKAVLEKILLPPYNWANEDKNKGLPVGEVEVKWYLPKLLTGFLDMTPSGGDKMDWSEVRGTPSSHFQRPLYAHTHNCSRFATTQFSRRCNRNATHP